MPKDVRAVPIKWMGEDDAVPTPANVFMLQGLRPDELYLTVGMALPPSDMKNTDHIDARMVARLVLARSTVMMLLEGLSQYLKDVEPEGNGT